MGSVGATGEAFVSCVRSFPVSLRFDPRLREGVRSCSVTKESASGSNWCTAEALSRVACSSMGCFTGVSKLQGVCSHTIPRPSIATRAPGGWVTTLTLTLACALGTGAAAGFGAAGVTVEAAAVDGGPSAGSAGVAAALCASCLLCPRDCVGVDFAIAHPNAARTSRPSRLPAIHHVRAFGRTLVM